MELTAQSALDFLRANAANFPEAQGAISQLGTTKVVRPSTLFFGKKLQTNGDLTGIRNVIEVTDPKANGIRNIDRGKLAAGTIFVVGGFKIEYANAATSANDVDTIALSNKIYDFMAAVPPARRIPIKVLNTEFELLRTNAKYYSGQLQDCFKESELDESFGVANRNTSGVIVLNNPLMLTENSELQVRLTFPNAGTAGTLDHFFRITWYGFQVADV
jgi:hypothetical protein